MHRWGSGPPVVLVHGATLGGRYTWIAQRPLAQRWTLVAPDRLGYGPGQAGLGEDVEADAPHVAELLGDGAHLVGFSSGGVVSMLAAARRPAAVRSLTLIEPPAWSLASGDPVVAERVRQLDAVRDEPDDAARLRRFYDGVGIDVPLPDPLPEPLLAGSRAFGRIAPLSAVEIPVEALAAAPFPKLVVTGGHDAAFDAVAAVLIERLDAMRAVVPGARHAVPTTGEPFNELVEAFWRSAG